MKKMWKDMYERADNKEDKERRETKRGSVRERQEEGDRVRREMLM